MRRCGEKKTKETPMKGYDKTNRNFLNTEEDEKAEKKEKEKLKPEKYPVADEPVIRKQ